jgi:uncharacterized protein YndB with AHSA1/START domain
MPAPIGLPTLGLVRIERSITLPASPEEAWRVLVQWESQPRWMGDADRVEVVSAAREGVGVRLGVRTRILGVPAFTEPIEVTGWAPPARLEVRHGGPVAGSGAWTLEPVDGGSHLTWTEEARLAVPVLGEFAAWLYAPVLRWFMGRALRDLRRYVIALGPAGGGERSG